MISLCKNNKINYYDEQREQPLQSSSTSKLKSYYDIKVSSVQGLSAGREMHFTPGKLQPYNNPRRFIQ